jgi:hypothetical protein
LGIITLCSHFYKKIDLILNIIGFHIKTIKMATTNSDIQKVINDELYFEFFKEYALYIPIMDISTTIDIVVEFCEEKLNSTPYRVEFTDPTSSNWDKSKIEQFKNKYTQKQKSCFIYFKNVNKDNEEIKNIMKLKKDYFEKRDLKKITPAGVNIYNDKISSTGKVYILPNINPKKYIDYVLTNDTNLLVKGLINKLVEKEEEITELNQLLIEKDEKINKLITEKEEIISIAKSNEIDSLNNEIQLLNVKLDEEQINNDELCEDNETLSNIIENQNKEIVNLEYKTNMLIDINQSLQSLSAYLINKKMFVDWTNNDESQTELNSTIIEDLNRINIKLIQLKLDNKKFYYQMGYQVGYQVGYQDGKSEFNI